VLSLVRGDIFGQYEAAERVAAGSGASFTPDVSRARAGRTRQDRRHRASTTRDHAAEQGKPLPVEPMIFLKPSTAVIAPGDPIRLPAGLAGSTTRPRWPSSSGRARHASGRVGRRAHPGRDVRERRDGPGPAEPGRPSIRTSRASTRFAPLGRASPSVWTRRTWG